MATLVNYTCKRFTKLIRVFHSRQILPATPPDNLIVVNGQFVTPQ